MGQIQILALHGHLGSMCDWGLVQKSFSEQLKNTSLDAEIVWTPLNLFTENSFFKSDMGQVNYKNVALSLTKQILPQHKVVFMGYSLGGRLGLELLNPEWAKLIDFFIFVSTHPGLADKNLQQERLQSDLVWKTKLRQLSSEEFLKQWNQQDVFKNHKATEPWSQNLLTNKLEWGFDEFSLGRQNEASARIHEQSLKITWVVGEEDTKFLNLAIELQQKKILSHLERIQNSGHRIMFEQPESLAQVLLQKVQLLSC